MFVVNSPIYAFLSDAQAVQTTGQLIVTLRMARGMSQPALAKAIGISQPSMHAIESGKTKKLRGDTLAGLCRVLNVSPDVLLGKRRLPNNEALLHEAELVSIWRSLTHEAQMHMLAVARALAGSVPPRPFEPGPTIGHTTQAGRLTEK